MPRPLNDELSAELAQIRAAGLYRTCREVASAQGPRLVIGGREFLNFSSNDYLGLANDPVVTQAAQEAIGRYGVGAGASRLVSGNLTPYRELEECLARFKNREAAIVFGSGYAANVGAITALVGKGDTVILDKLDHASIIDGARQSGATIRVYPHKNLKKLADLLASATGRVLIITETVFSMDGDLAPLKEIVALKEKHGAWLMIDEAHATGLYGHNRRGLAEPLDVEDKIDITLGTLSKALGCAGGFVVGSQTLIDYLRNRARSLIYSTALPPAIVAAARAAVEFVMSEAGHQRRDELWRNVSEMKHGLAKLGIQNESRSPIIPIIIGDEQAAVELSAKLYEQGIFVPAIRYPTVPKGKARLRVTVTAGHTGAEVAKLIEVLQQSRGREAVSTAATARLRVVGAASPPRPAHSGVLRKGRVSITDDCYFVTTCVAERRPVFQNAERARVIVDTLRWLRDQGRLRLLGYVVMPDHVHFALALGAGNLPVVLHSLKSYTSHRLTAEFGVKSPVWQDGYHDHHLRERRDFLKRLDYMHDNPVRAGLAQVPAEYLFSTAHPEGERDIDWNWFEGVSP